MKKRSLGPLGLLLISWITLISIGSMGCLVLNPNYDGPAGATAGTGGDMKICGDQVVDVDIGEACDDGNTQDGDGCNANCQWEIGALCGNGVLDIDSEECDSAIPPGGEGYQGPCSPACKLLASCGDGKIDVGEQCDDGNLQNGDNCNANCQWENPPSGCGNGILERGEQCDDGNTIDSDNCSSTCLVEPSEHCGFNKPEDCGKHLWSFNFGDLTNDDQINSVASDTQGNIYATGYFKGTMDFNANVPGNPIMDNGPSQNWNAFLVKYNQDGVHLWHKVFGSSQNNSQGIKVAVDGSDQVYLLGIFGGSNFNLGGDFLPAFGVTDIFLTKFDSNGSHLWSYSFGGDRQDFPTDMAVNSSGRVAITGHTDSTKIELGKGAIDQGGEMFTDDSFLAQYDAQGTALITITIPDLYGPLSFEDEHIELDSKNNMFLSGIITSGSWDLGNGVTLTGGVNESFFIAKYSSANNGAAQWAKSFDKEENLPTSLLSSSALDLNENIWISGRVSNESINFGGGPLADTNFYAAYQSTDGSYLESNVIPSENTNSSETALDMHFDKSGNLWIAGRSVGLDPNMPQSTLVGYFIAKFDPKRQSLWHHDYVSPFSQLYGSTIELTTDPQGYAIAGGNMQGMLNFGGKDLSSPGSTDAFLAKFFP